MAGINTGAVLSHALRYIDPNVVTPKKGDLLGRTLFQVRPIPGLYTQTYEYIWKERSGQASDVTNRATDITTTDVTYHQEIGYIKEKAAALEYSDDELGTAQQAGIDILTDKTQAVHDALADWEDRLIFNGDDDSQHPVYGLTTDPSVAQFQVADDAPVTFDKPIDPSNTNGYNDAMKIYNWLLDAANKIKFLPGYTNASLVLALPQKEYSELQRPYNQYSPHDTILNMLQDQANGGAVFGQVVQVPELQAKYWNTKKGADGKKDMGMIFLNDPDTANIPVAMNPQRIGAPVPDHQKYTITYKERMGGLCIKFPAGFVRLNGIN